MNLLESLRIALSSIFSQKLRSSLTLLGVVIGVVTIIATMSIIKGMQNMIEEEMSILSAGVYQIQRYDRNMGGGGHHRRHNFRPKIGWKEVRALQEHASLTKIVAPEVWKYGITMKRDNLLTNPNIVVAGGVPGFSPNNGYEVEYGRFINDQDVHFGRSVIVIGSDVANKLFPYGNPIGEDITVNGQTAQVIGVYTSRGSMFDSGSDNHCTVPITTFQNWWGTQRSWIITMQVYDTSKIDEAIAQATNILRSNRNVKPGEENNFYMFYSNQLVDQFSEMTQGIRIAAFGIASIALLVAGVGIMNIMLVSVTERTREIGVRKALGARRVAIMGQFLVEAIILTEIGAFIGVVVGVVAAIMLGKAIDLPVAIPMWSVFIGILFCSIIGLLFGTWPAWKASRLDPIEALRYE